VLGFVYSLCTTAYTVLFLRAAQGTLVKEAPAAKTGSTVGASSSKPYSEDTIRFLLKSTILSGAVSILATRAGNDFATPIRTVFFFLTTFASYVWGARLPSGFTKAVHPLITSTVLTLGVICLTAIATGTSDWIDVLKTYKVGTLDLMKMGAADIMTFLLGPAVVSFAISMYSRRKLLKENLLIVVSAMLVTSVGGLFGTAAFVRAIQLGGKNGLMVRLSVLSRNVTTALAMACTAMLEGDISLAVTIVVLTGILGATYGRTMLDAMGIYDPVTRGLAVGGAAQGLGVSSMVSEPDAFPFAAMSMILTAISATVLVSIPAVKDALVNICTP
jgi:putative effector of murein hydrolase